MTTLLAQQLSQISRTSKSDAGGAIKGTASLLFSPQEAAERGDAYKRGRQGVALMLDSLSPSLPSSTHTHTHTHTHRAACL